MRRSRLGRYCKYNTVLRDLGHLRSQQTQGQRSSQSAKEISEALHSYQMQRLKEEQAAPSRLKKVKPDTPSSRRPSVAPENALLETVGIVFPGHTEGNLYTTTL